MQSPARLERAQLARWVKKAEGRGDTGSQCKGLPPNYAPNQHVHVRLGLKLQPEQPEADQDSNGPRC